MKSSVEISAYAHEFVVKNRLGDYEEPLIEKAMRFALAHAQEVPHITDEQLIEAWGHATGHSTVATVQALRSFFNWLRWM